MIYLFIILLEFFDKESIYEGEKSFLNIHFLSSDFSIQPYLKSNIKNKFNKCSPIKHINLLSKFNIDIINERLIFDLKNYLDDKSLNNDLEIVPYYIIANSTSYIQIDNTNKYFIY
jgi:hypothetical protein